MRYASFKPSVQKACLNWRKGIIVICLKQLRIFLLVLHKTLSEI